MKYKIIYQGNNKIKYKIVDSVENNQLPKNLIEIKKVETLSLSNISFFEKITHKDLKNIFYELSLMLNSNILLDEALEILKKKQKKDILKDFLTEVRNSFVEKNSIYEKLKNFKTPALVNSFFKITQDSGNIIENMNSLEMIISQDYEIKKEFKKVLVYPAILFVTSLLTLIGMFKFVVPKFQFILEQNKLEMNFATKSLLFVKDIFENDLIFLVSILCSLVFLGVYTYKNNTNFRYKIDKIMALNIPIFSSLYKNRIFYIYFLVIELLLKGKYEFYDCLIKSRILINNQFLLVKISQLENLLENGKAVSFAFEYIDIFDDITLSLMATGEITNSLEIATSEVKNINKRRFEESVKLFSIFIEPVFFIIISSLILWLVLGLFVPLWSIGEMLK